MEIEGFTKIGALPNGQFDLAMLLVVIERSRQVLDKGYGPEHDDAHVEGELAAAAACYAAGGEVSVGGRGLWPWAAAPVPSAAVPVLRRLAITGALVLAEIERLLRAGANPESAMSADLPPEMLEVLLAASQPGTQMPVLCRCIACGCDDLHACEGLFGDPCHWLRVDRDAGLGVCSECPEAVDAWDRGERVVFALSDLR